MEAPKGVGFIKPKVMENEEAKALLGIFLVLVSLTTLNLYLYISEGLFLRLTIPLGLATILLFLLKNPALSLLLALALSALIFPEVCGNAFFSFIRRHLGYTVLAILVIGGFLKVLTESEGGRQLNISVRKLSKSILWRKIAGVAITIFNCFSSPATVSAIHLLFKEDLESKRIALEDKSDLVRIMVMFSNISCTLIPVSLWWLYFKGFSSPEIEVKYLNILPFLFYPFVVIGYWFAFRMWKESKSPYSENSKRSIEIREVILEQRQFKAKPFILLFLVPMLLTFGIIVYYGFFQRGGVGLFNDKTFVLGAFSVGSLALLCVLGGFQIVKTRFQLHETREIANLMDNGSRKIDRLIKEIKSSIGRETGRGFLGRSHNLGMHVLSTVAQRAKLSTAERQELRGLDFYYKYNASKLPTKCYLALKNIADVSGSFYTDFLIGAKGMIGTAILLVSAWALKEIIATKGMYLYPSPQECRIMLSVLPIEFMPIAMFILTTLIGLVIGTSWGTFAVMFSFVLVIRTAMGEGQLSMENQFLLNAILGAIISASVFINQSSKQADNVVITSQLTEKQEEEILKITKTDRWICYGFTFAAYLILCIIYRFLVA